MWLDFAEPRDVPVTPAVRRTPRSQRVIAIIQFVAGAAVDMVVTVAPLFWLMLLLASLAVEAGIIS